MAGVVVVLLMPSRVLWTRYTILYVLVKVILVFGISPSLPAPFQALPMFGLRAPRNQRPTHQRSPSARRLGARHKNFRLLLLVPSPRLHHIDFIATNTHVCRAT